MTRLTDCYSDVFTYVLSLRQAGGADTPHHTVNADICGLLEKAETRAAAAGFAPEAVADAKFAVCAWVDETLLRSDWDGVKAWRTQQLQQRYFATYNAGVEFFHRLEALGQAPDAPARETYALCLGLGFTGEYFPADREADLEAIRRQALRAAAPSPAPAYGEPGNVLFPDAYQPRPVKGTRFNPWAFDWWFFLVPVLTVVIAAELYFLLRNDLNLQLLRYFGSLG